ncbi:uncharacterized protein [Muntiacus reevesi]|uniref:uncharacterized protein n=1 Tax=Muntiacus reevesi TaxID=9886 RepID=UPI003306B5E2
MCKRKTTPPSGLVSVLLDLPRDRYPRPTPEGDHFAWSPSIGDGIVSGRKVSRHIFLEDGGFGQVLGGRRRQEWRYLSARGSESKYTGLRPVGRPLRLTPAVPQAAAGRARAGGGSVFKEDTFRLIPCRQGPPVDEELMPRCLPLTSVLRGRQEQEFLDPTSKQSNPWAVTAPAGPGRMKKTRTDQPAKRRSVNIFPNRLVDHVPLTPLITFLTLLVCSSTALRTSPVRRALGAPAPPPVKPIYIRCLPSSPSVSPPTHRFVVSSGPLNSTSSKSHLPPPKTRWQEPRRPRIVNAWTEEVEELPWSSTPSGGSPDVSRLPRAATLLPGSGRSHHLESSAVQDLEPATPAPSSSIIPQGTPARGPTGQAGPKDSGPGLPPTLRGGVCPPHLPAL